MNWLNTVLIFLGGGFGAVLRNVLTNSSVSANSSIFTHTLVINALGSFIIGFIWNFQLSMEIRCFAVVGLLGGFTTFSGFSIEFLEFLHHKSLGLAWVYVISTVSLCILLVWSGNRLQSLLF